MESIDHKNREKVLYVIFLNFSYCCLLSGFCFSGGILGWDPVHTTCIFCEKSYKIS